MTWMYELLSWSTTPLHTLRFIEARLMRENYAGHEAVRMCLQVFAEYKPSADPTWLVRQLATELSAYSRAKMSLGVNPGNIEHLVRYIMRVTRERLADGEVSHWNRVVRFEIEHQRAAHEWYFGFELFSHPAMTAPIETLAAALRAAGTF